MAVSEKIQALFEIKEGIKNKIISVGGQITDSTPFGEYEDHIGGVPIEDLNTYYVGTTPPDSSLGVDGDIYLRIIR